MSNAQIDALLYYSRGGRTPMPETEALIAAGMLAADLSITRSGANILRLVEVVELLRPVEFSASAEVVQDGDW